MMLCLGIMTAWATASSRERAAFMVMSIAGFFFVVVVALFYALSPNIIPEFMQKLADGAAVAQKSARSMAESVKKIRTVVKKNIDDFRDEHQDHFGADGKTL